MQPFDLYKTRREALVERIVKTGKTQERIVLLSADFEQGHHSFRQESSFYYFTGITEPGVFLVIESSGKTILYVPNYAVKRAQWVTDSITPEVQAARAGVDEIKYLGEPYPGYQFSLLFNGEQVSYLLKDLQKYIEKGMAIYSLYPNSQEEYITQQISIGRLSAFLPLLKDTIKDISGVVASMRRVKSSKEIELLYKSVECTMVAQSGASQVIAPGKKEAEVQAAIEYIFTEAGGRAAFPSIVASGKNATVLHYTHNSHILNKNDLVIVDIGVDLDYYCADITRTFPVSGKYSKRQRQIYNIVLATQEFVADKAAPGYWLFNPEQPDKSLHHLAIQFLKDQGYDKYFVHGIGHFLGLDVHDVGNREEPLQVGDVITIEPGIYIPEENLGVRIEDDYWIVKDGAICISHDLPREAEEIEEMMAEDFADSADDEE